MNAINNNLAQVFQKKDGGTCIQNSNLSDSHKDEDSAFEESEDDEDKIIVKDKESENEGSNNEDENEEIKIIKKDKKLTEIEKVDLTFKKYSKTTLFGMVATQSRSYNSLREKTKIPVTNIIPPKSPPLSLSRPTSPQPPSSHSTNNLAPSGSPLNRKPNGTPDSKLVVLGTPSVGKSAIVVRLMTGRFIWEYDPTLEAVYRYNTTVDDDPATIEILDTAGLIEGKVNEGHMRWGDGFLIVYSLTDRESFLAVPGIHSAIASIKHTPNFPCVVLANKSDLVHLSNVCDKEASNQASDLGVSFFSASACEGSSTLWEAFSELHRDVVRRYGNRRRKSSAKVVIEGFYKMFTR